jgi:hypothetical protein
MPVSEGLKMTYVNKSSKDMQLLIWLFFLECEPLWWSCKISMRFLVDSENWR